MSWWNAQATQNANRRSTYTMYGTEFYTDTNQPVSQTSRVNAPITPTAKQDMGVGTGSTYVDPNSAIGQAMANAPEPPSNPIRSNSEVNLNPLRFSDPGGDENIVITQESLPTIQAERPDVYEAITTQPQQEVSQPVISEPSTYEGTVQDTLNESSQDYADNNPGAQSFEEYVNNSETVAEQDSQQESSPIDFSSSEEYITLTNRIDELEKQLAAQDVGTSSISKSTQTRARGDGGLIGSIINKNSVLVDSGSLKIGGQVYGPDGSIYPSVTDAIQAGVYNFTYFPISTGVKQENKPLTRRFANAPTQTSNEPANFLEGM